VRDELSNLTPSDFSCYPYLMDNRHDAPATALLIRSPFPLGKGLEVRFLGQHYAAKTIFDGTKLPLVVDTYEHHNRWYKIAFYAAERVANPT
jgi:hypothetical protein